MGGDVMDAVRGRLQLFLDKKGLSKRNLSLRIGKNENYISQYMCGHIDKPTDYLYQYLESYYLVNLEWLFDGKGEMFLQNGGSGWAGSYQGRLFRKVVALPEDQQKVVEQIVDAFTFKNQAEKQES